MHRVTRMLILALLSLLIVLTFAGAASATREFTVEPAGRIEAPSSGKLRFTGGGIIAECNYTLNGILANGPILTAGGQVGEITEVRIRECTGGEIERVLNLPWRIVSNGILGTLPDRITGLLLEIVEVRIMWAVFGRFIRCLYEGNLGALLRLTGRGPYTSERIRALESSVFTRVSGVSCPREGSMSGSLELRPAQRIVFR